MESTLNITNEYIGDLLQKGDSVGIIAIKPGNIPLSPEGLPVQSLLEGLIQSSGLEVLSVRTIQLSESDVRNIYANVMIDRDGSPPPEWLTELRSNLINYMTEEPFVSYLCIGEGACKVVGMIKEVFRNWHEQHRDSGLEVRNLVHAGEQHEVRENIRIFFGNNINE